jgi:hypothetical protein
MATLLRHQPGRLAEALALTAAALAIKCTIHPAATEIWKTYDILAIIAAQEGRTADAQTFRRQARETWARSPGARRALRQYSPLIGLVVAAVANPERRALLEETLEQRITPDKGQLVAIIRRVLDGERDIDILCEPLDWEDALMVQVILQGLENPDTLRELLGVDP